MRTLATLAAGILALSATGSLSGEYYGACATYSDAGYKLDIDPGEPNPILTYGGKQHDYKVLSKITLDQKEGYCLSSDGSKYEWQSHDFVLEIRAYLDGQDTTLLFLCTDNSSGVPAGVADCKNKISLHKRLKPNYSTEKP